ncbi:TOBE domain-containing protein [Desulfurispirillum indicum]|uniref:TOBE domain-containing protein n=1 Tax=Desulfurispirillum indicum TaxID=936456 RepID=UPI001CFBE235|nr:TOBE domain-containing protein [Desulfurispirillum indicum]UCZ55902.1 TOBE domain-containing protein [Desulfurispirillum indicum]
MGMTDNQPFVLSEKRIELLRQIDRCGSLSAAAKAAGMSYKGAWDAVDAINNLSEKVLVERISGGRGGGGSLLTEEGKRVLRMYDLYAEAQRHFMAEIARHGGSAQSMENFFRRIGMKTSARNQFSGRVSRLRRGAVNDEVVVGLSGGDEITAIVTRDSAEAMELAEGREVYALVKASSILLATQKPENISARNVLGGTVERVTGGEVNAEVVLELPGQARLAAVITRESLERLELKAGQPAWAVFKASSVILGV